jgi:hypothetical protein
MIRYRLPGIALIALIALGALVPDAQAIPAFARKHNVTCSTCHAAVPYLNATGRTFKEAGYRMPDEDGVIDDEAQPNREISSALVLDKTFPIAARLKGYVVDKKKGEDTKIRPTHEIEVFFGANFWRSGSLFVEMEGEDEEGFSLVSAGTFGWHPSRAANFKLGIGSIVHPDPYNSLQDGGMRLTVSHKIPLDVGSNLGARFRKDAQFINFYGRVSSLFYSLSYSAGNGNDEGEHPRDYMGRLAFDITPEIMLGAFYFSATRDSEEDGEVDLTRIGGDFNFSFAKSIYLLGMYMISKEELGGSSKENASGYVEGFYAWAKDDRPFLVPLLRYDWTEENDGADKHSVLTAQLGAYLIENAKLAFEYSKEIDVPGDGEKSDRVTLMADIVF